MVTISYDITRFNKQSAPLTCKTFTVREVTSKDEDVASANAKAKGKDGSVLDELIRLSVTEVDGQAKDAKSILNVLTLGVSQGTTITVRADGPQADAAVAALTDLVDRDFGE